MESPGYYVGPIDALVQLPDAVGTLARSGPRKETVHQSVAGGLRVFRAPRINREWQVEIPNCEPWEYAQLVDLDRFGKPPFWFIDPYAATHNLAPAAWNAGNGGGRMVSEGRAFQTSSIWATRQEWVRAQQGAPVVPGVPVTVSAYLRGFAGGQGVYLWAELLDAAGNVVSGSTVDQYSSSDGRVAITIPSPPANAVSVRVGHHWVTQMAGLAVTWTTKPVSWFPGMGCSTAYLSDVSDEPSQVLEDKGLQTLASVKFKVRELG